MPFILEIGVDYDAADAGDLVNYNKLLVCQFFAVLAACWDLEKLENCHLSSGGICNCQGRTMTKG